MKSYRNSVGLGYFAIALGFVLVAFVGPYLTSNLFTRSLKAASELTALQWASYLTSSTPELEVILGGGQASAHSYHMLDVRKSGADGVFRTQLYSKNLELLYDSTHGATYSGTDKATGETGADHAHAHHALPIISMATAQMSRCPRRGRRVMPMPPAEKKAQGMPILPARL
ncbi:hypothetical protein [Roseibium sp.]|uniref:hypothetical protein n=1 Tax=Roseibium sp. TaxID=1936156 RepID=UPI003B5029F7